MLYLHENYCEKPNIEFRIDYPQGLDDLEITSYEFLFSYFYEILLSEGPQNRDYLQYLWTEQRDIFANINIIFDGNICDFLLLSPKFISIGNKICVKQHETILRNSEAKRIENKIKRMKENKNYYFYEKKFILKKNSSFTFTLSNLPSLESIISINQKMKNKLHLRHSAHIKILIKSTNQLIININPEMSNIDELSINNNLDLTLLSFNFRYITHMTMEEIEILSLLIMEHASIINNKISYEENTYLSFNKKQLLASVLISNSNLENLVKSLLVVEENVKKQTITLMILMDEINSTIKNREEELKRTMQLLKDTMQNSQNEFRQKIVDYELFLKSCLSLEVSMVLQKCNSLWSLFDWNENDEFNNQNCMLSQAYCNRFIKEWTFVLFKEQQNINNLKTKAECLSKIVTNNLEYKNDLAKDILFTISSSLSENKFGNNNISKEFVYEFGKGLLSKDDKILEPVKRNVCKTNHKFAKRLSIMKTDVSLRVALELLYDYIPNYDNFEIFIPPNIISKLNTLKPCDINDFVAEIIQKYINDISKSKISSTKCELVTPITLLILSNVNETVNDFITVRALILKTEYRLTIHSISIEYKFFGKLLPKEKIDKSTYVTESFFDVKNEENIKDNNLLDHNEVKKKCKTKLEPNSLELVEKRNYASSKSSLINMKYKSDYYAVDFHKQIQDRLFEKYQDRSKEEIFLCLKAIQDKNNLTWFSVDDVLQIFEAELLLRDRHLHVFNYNQSNFRYSCTAIEENCPICRDSLKKYRIYQLSCRHWFHLLCIRTWFEQTKQCPICRTSSTILIEEFPPLK